MHIHYAYCTVIFSTDLFETNFELGLQLPQVILHMLTSGNGSQFFMVIYHSRMEGFLLSLPLLK